MLHAPACESKQAHTASHTRLNGENGQQLYSPLTAIPQRNPHGGYGNQAILRMLSRTAPALQPKLTVSRPGDAFEQEADRVAERVMRMPGHAVQRACSCGSSGGECAACKEEGTLHRFAHGHAESFPAPAIVHEVLRSGGQPLDHSTRSFMEPRFGCDFSQVRVHSGARASESARSVNALAYTVGDHTVFGAGQYSPASHAGRQLIAHELAHVVQQSASPPVLARQQTDEQQTSNTTAGPADAGLPGGVSTPPVADDSDQTPAATQTGPGSSPCLDDCEQKFQDCLNPPIWQFWKTPDPNQCLAERQACQRDCQEASKGRWSCEASCNVEGTEPQCTGRVTGSSSGKSSEDEACREAKRDATQKAPRGCYARHCRCFNCTDR
jgi:hypothetical protein